MKPRSRGRWKGWLALAITFGVLGGTAFAIFQWIPIGNGRSINALTHQVAVRTIQDTVVEQGTLESRNTVYGRCELPGWQNKILSIVPEGTIVQAGDVVVQFDGSEFQKYVDEQKINFNEAKGELEQAQQELLVQVNKNASDVSAAELALTLAKLDLDKYRDGELIMTQADYESSIAERGAELEKITDELENIRTLIKRGFRSPEQLRELELRKSSAEYAVERDRRKLEVLNEFEAPRKITELEANAVEAERQLDRAKTTASAEQKKAEMKIANATTKVQLEEKELEQYLKIMERCVIKAPKAGTVAYANMPWMDDDERIRDGASVRESQNVFYLPDMSAMQVLVNVHESVINKIKKGQRASIRVDAYPDRSFAGITESVSQLANSSYYAEAKAYQVMVVIDEIPAEVQLKPGMTAQVEILVDTYRDILAVPINAVTEHFKDSYAYVVNGDAVSKRKVNVGRSTNAFVEILTGLESGEVVVLDAYQRGIAEFGNVESMAEQERVEEQRPEEMAKGGDGPDEESSAAPTGQDDDLFPPLDSEALFGDSESEESSSEDTSSTDSSQLESVQPPDASTPQVPQDSAANPNPPVDAPPSESTNAAGTGGTPP